MYAGLRPQFSFNLPQKSVQFLSLSAENASLLSDAAYIVETIKNNLTCLVRNHRHNVTVSKTGQWDGDGLSERQTNTNGEVGPTISK